jgi:hypothetical protein
LAVGPLTAGRRAVLAMPAHGGIPTPAHLTAFVCPQPGSPFPALSAVGSPGAAVRAGDHLERDEPPRAQGRVAADRTTAAVAWPGLSAPTLQGILLPARTADRGEIVSVAAIPHPVNVDGIIEPDRFTTHGAGGARRASGVNPLDSLRVSPGQGVEVPGELLGREQLHGSGEALRVDHGVTDLTIVFVDSATGPAYAGGAGLTAPGLPRPRAAKGQCPGPLHRPVVKIGAAIAAQPCRPVVRGVRQRGNSAVRGCARPGRSGPAGGSVEEAVSI